MLKNTKVENLWGNEKMSSTVGKELCSMAHTCLRLKKNHIRLQK